MRRHNVRVLKPELDLGDIGVVFQCVRGGGRIRGSPSSDPV